MDPVTINLARIHDRIAAAGGDPASVRVVAVTKGLPAEAVDAAVAAGLVDLGENHMQELARKAADAPASVRWHLIGPVQRNKVARTAPYVHLWHAIDRGAAGVAVARYAPGGAVLVQVNVSEEPQKHGCSPEQAPRLVEELRAVGLDVRGVMAVGPQGPEDVVRAAFRTGAGIASRLDLPEISMGMSGDLEIAVQEGATMVRVGTALFGPRPQGRGLRR